jgi:uncharacterized protein (TIGR03083 family)
VDVPGYVTQLRGDGDRVAVVLADADLDAPVPSCPDWCLRELVHHLGGVHRWATAFVRAEPDQPEGGDLEDIVGGWPTDDDLGSWFVEGHRHLVAAIERAPADLDTWTFLEAPSPLVFWARRQAHETAIHRVDAELAVGDVTAFPAPFAADGIDELLLRFAAGPGRELPIDRPRTIEIRAADLDRSWLVTCTSDGFEIEANPGEPRPDVDTTVTGSTSDLYTWLWNRRSADGLLVRGDEATLELWRDAVRITWS